MKKFWSTYAYWVYVTITLLLMLAALSYIGDPVTGEKFAGFTWPQMLKTGFYIGVAITILCLPKMLYTRFSFKVGEAALIHVALTTFVLVWYHILFRTAALFAGPFVADVILIVATTVLLVLQYPLPKKPNS